MKTVRVAVYSIALNEASFVKRWCESAAGADLILLGDTGSTDNTVALAREAGAEVAPLRVSPWRFDDARNALLAAIPLDIDYCIALDLDEVLLPGWKLELQKALELGLTRPRYLYTWSWADADRTVPGLQYLGDKIHSRSSYRWIHPVHETLTSYGSSPVREGEIDLRINHYPDSSKSRSQYLPLLEMAVQERPTDARCLFYLGREYSFYGQTDLAILRLSECLYDLPPMWAPERAAARRLLAKLVPSRAEALLRQAVADAPDRREPLMDLAQLYYDRQNWNSCRYFAEKALTITKKSLDYLCEREAWSALPHDLIAISAYHLNDFEAALLHGEQAAALEPSDLRLQRNISFYRKGLASNAAADVAATLTIAASESPLASEGEGAGGVTRLVLRSGSLPGSTR